MTDPELADLARGFVIYAVMSVWMTAGFAAWLCHTWIEKTSGTGNPSCTVCYCSIRV